MNKSTAPIRIVCPHCRTILESDEPIESASVECPACGVAFTPAVENSKPKWWQHPNKWWIVAGGIALLALIFGVGKGKPSQSPGDNHVKVNPALNFRSEAEYVRSFGGRAKSGKYTFSPHEHMFDFHDVEGNDWANASGPFQYHRVDLFDFNSPPGPCWKLYDSGMESYPRAWIWERDDGYFLESHPKYGENMRYVQSHDQRKLQQSALMPAPVLVSYGQDIGYGTCYLYLNEAGNPSVLEWSRRGEMYFTCLEGAKDLAAYANCLRELREKLVAYTETAKKKKLGEYSEALEVESQPVVYIGDLSRGTRARAELEYSFEVKPKGLSISTNTTFILERRKSNGRTKQTFMDLDAIDRKISQFKMFESKKSMEAAFEPLYAFLTWRRNQ